ncbi:MAG: methylmalonyl Co-A mutase-associated GTPase MeaB [Candidatus Marinimicrobia bacterium]|nr:methylmalonyl Co-A mutase-associated GTPase MeaB [Candidatus Neomarinimicrobiota bacterium]
MYENFLENLKSKKHNFIAKAISAIENDTELKAFLLSKIQFKKSTSIRIGITGPPGAGKSSITNRLIKKYRSENKTVCALLVDPTSPFSNGSVLGDRIRINQFYDDKEVFIRSLASRGSKGGLSYDIDTIADLIDFIGFDIIIIETVGVGQIELDVIESVDSVVVVLVPESGDDIQIMKAGLIEIADLYVINKSEREDADKLFIILTNMLQLVKNKKWIPEIIKTVAIENIGIDELYKNLEKHKKFLLDSDGFDFKNNKRFIKKIKNEIVKNFEDSFWTSNRLNFIEDFFRKKKIQKISLSSIIKKLKDIS